MPRPPPKAMATKPSLVNTENVRRGPYEWHKTQTPMNSICEMAPWIFISGHFVCAGSLAHPEPEDLGWGARVLTFAVFTHF
jgi:hypothetical protein